MEKEILSWLDTTRETRQETGFVQRDFMEWICQSWWS